MLKAFLSYWNSIRSILFFVFVLILRANAASAIPLTLSDYLNWEMDYRHKKMSQSWKLRAECQKLESERMSEFFRISFFRPSNFQKILFDYQTISSEEHP